MWHSDSELSKRGCLLLWFGMTCAYLFACATCRPIRGNTSTFISNATAYIVVDNFGEIATIAGKTVPSGIKWIAFGLGRYDFSVTVPTIAISLHYGTKEPLEKPYSTSLAIITSYGQFVDVNQNNKIDFPGQDLAPLPIIFENVGDPSMFTTEDVLAQTISYDLEIQTNDQSFGVFCKLNNSLVDKSALDISEMKCNIKIQNFPLIHQDLYKVFLNIFFVSGSFSEGSTIGKNLLIGDGATFLKWNERMQIFRTNSFQEPTKESAIYSDTQLISLLETYKRAILFQTLRAQGQTGFVNETWIFEQMQGIQPEQAEQAIFFVNTLPDGINTTLASTFFVFNPKGKANFFWDPTLGVLLGTSGEIGENGKNGNSDGFATVNAVLLAIGMFLFILVVITGFIIVVLYYSSETVRKFINGRKINKLNKVRPQDCSINEADMQL